MAGDAVTGIHKLVITYGDGREETRDCPCVWCDICRAVFTPEAMARLDAYALGTFTAACGTEREPDGEPCTGTLTFGPADPQARCPVCGGWTGVLVAKPEARPEWLGP
jgi:hypothetical protein